MGFFCKGLKKEEGLSVQCSEVIFEFNGGTKLYGPVPFYPKMTELKVTNTK